MSYERKVVVTGGIPDAYELFKEWKPQHSNINKKKYTDVCHLINKKISDAIVKESLEIKLPFRLGYIRVRAHKYKIKFKDGKLDIAKNAIDWKATRKLWDEMYPGKTLDELKEIPDKKLIIHTNDHSNGMYYRWYWDKRLSNIRNIRSYVFKPVKGPQSDKDFVKHGEYYYGRRGLVKWIKNEDRFNEYYM